MVRPGLRQGRTDAERLDGPVAGPEIVQVVVVGAEDHVLDAPLLRNIQEPVAQAGLAVETPVRVVGREVRVLHLARLDGHQLDADALGRLAGPLIQMAGLGGPDARARQHVLGPQRIHRRLEQKRAIHAARIGDDHLAQVLQDLLQRFVFVFESSCPVLRFRLGPCSVQKLFQPQFPGGSSQILEIQRVPLHRQHPQNIVPLPLRRAAGLPKPIAVSAG